jgi:hypothetical protein
MNEKLKTRTDAANYLQMKWGGGTGELTGGTRAGRTGGTRADGAGGRDPKPTLTLICADPKPYSLWNTHSPAFKIWKCRCWVRDLLGEILKDCEASMQVSETFRKP